MLFPRNYALRNSALLVRYISTQQTRNTMIFQHLYQPERTPDGCPQRRPDEKQEFQKLEIVEEESTRNTSPTLKVILMCTIEGLGEKYDVVEVTRAKARLHLIPPRKAIYASPFDIEYYGKMRKSNEEEVPTIRVPLELVKTARALMEKVIPLHMSMDIPWTINKTVIKAPLMKLGLEMSEECIYLPKETVSGPDLSLEARLYRFYVVVDRQYIVPVLGRILHGSKGKQSHNLNPKTKKMPTDEDLKSFGLRREHPVYLNEPFGEEFDVIKHMEDQNFETSKKI
ncbi:Mitochondrial Ribosomal Protein, Large [Ditylenchus destructor]|uniref:Large ribosomal subunit protein bL9m n=1 Tax=Ditylenchus destructor TaxID=166010 RepID=A0AAD4NLW6_9BILA|nr:Mitochondrial Ribosomal Protein, Large [Ditylenchus destructor]